MVRHLRTYFIFYITKIKWMCFQKKLHFLVRHKDQGGVQSNFQEISLLLQRKKSKTYCKNIRCLDSNAVKITQYDSPKQSCVVSTMPLSKAIYAMPMGFGVTFQKLSLIPFNVCKTGPGQQSKTPD